MNFREMRDLTTAPQPEIFRLEFREIGFWMGGMMELARDHVQWQDFVLLPNVSF
jgi:hypothetical protein